MPTDDAPLYQDTHDHTHRHAPASKSRARLWIVLALTFLYMLAELIGGWWTGSLALLADAGHMLTDVAALALALAAMWFAMRPATPQKTFGYYRVEILAALVNGVSLVVISVFIFVEAIGRWNAPPDVQSGPMMLVATGGLLVNLLSAWLLRGGHEHDLNVRGAWLHILTDALSSLGAIIAGAVIWRFGWQRADPLISVIIGLLVIVSAWRLVRESVNVLLEGAPKHINLAAVEAAMRRAEGVRAVHDLHVWTIASGLEALSAHVIHGYEVKPLAILKQLRATLQDEFGISHLTIQMETPDFEQDDEELCHCGPEESRQKAAQM
jgi:cobalt-zinc-cadmium efflux system protein